MRDRRFGSERAMRKANAPPVAIQVSISMQGGRRAIAALLERAVRSRVVFCATDVIGAGAVFKDTRRKIAIAGCDDLEIAV